MGCLEKKKLLYIKETTKEHFDFEYNESENNSISFRVSNLLDSDKRNVGKINVKNSVYLAHYYRHIFQLVKFVVNQRKDILSYEDKRKYLRLLRAQLSEPEQVMLFYNWYSNYGVKWEQNVGEYKKMVEINSSLIIGCYTIYTKKLFLMILSLKIYLI